MNFLDALRMTEALQATDARDKYFAIAGLCHDSAYFLTVPDYKASLAIVRAEMALNYIFATRNVDIIITADQ